jgi:NTE family protein
MTKSSKNINLVLSGGGARGIAHIGVIEELEKHGYVIRSISGTSMGALIGAVYAIGKLKEFKLWLYTFGKYDIFKLMDFTISKQGFIKGDKIFEKMGEFISDTTFDQLSIPLAISATNISSNKEIVFDSGSVFDAVRASISIPNVFTPVEVDNSIIIDGGIINNLPISTIQRFDNDLLVVVDVNKTHVSDLNKKLGYFDILNKSILILMERVTELTIDKYKPDIIIKVSGESAGLLDFYKAKLLVDLGRSEAVNCLKNK